MLWRQATEHCRRGCPHKQCHVIFKGFKCGVSGTFEQGSRICSCKCCPPCSTPTFSRKFDGNRLKPEVNVSTCSTRGRQPLINITPMLSVFSAPPLSGSSLAPGSLSCTYTAFFSIYMPVSMNSNEDCCCRSVCRWPSQSVLAQILLCLAERNALVHTGHRQF